MSKQVELKSGDGFGVAAYVAEPQNQPQAGIVILQEIFGVNQHIRNVTDRYAAQGYLAIAPALFDRVRKGIELGYNDSTMKEGSEIRAQIPLEKTLLDVDAAIAWLRAAGMTRVGVVGYCWGGSLAWLANTRLQAEATVSYYGGMIADHAAEQNRAPAMFHFGERDKHIPATDWAKIRSAHPELPLYTYDADHGFNCDARASYDEAAASLARERTLAFLKANLGA